MLAVYKRDGPYTVHTDSCDRQADDALLLEQDDSSDRPIGYWSRAIREAQKPSSLFTVSIWCHMSGSHYRTEIRRNHCPHRERSAYLAVVVLLVRLYRKTRTKVLTTFETCLWSPSQILRQTPGCRRATTIFYYRHWWWRYQLWKPSIGNLTQYL